MLSPQQLADYQPWIDPGRRLRDLAHQLETLSLEAMRTAEGWKGYLSAGVESCSRSAESEAGFSRRSQMAVQPWRGGPADAAAPRSGPATPAP